MRSAKSSFILMLGMTWAGTALAVPTLRLTPSEVAPELGSAFPIAIEVTGLGASGAPSIGTYHLVIQFDPSEVSLVDLSPGDPQQGNQLALQGSKTVSSFVLKAPGELELLEVSLNDALTLDNAQASGFTLATLFFNASASGRSTVTLKVKSLGDSSGSGLTSLLANGGLSTIRVSSSVAAVSSEDVCFDTDEDFADVPAGDVNGILVQEGVRFAERLAGQSLKTGRGIDSLTGAPTNPLFLAAGASGENLYRGRSGRSLELSGKSAAGPLQGTTAVLFDRDQSELALELFHVGLNLILVDFYDRSGRKLDRFIASSEDGRLARGFKRHGGVADIAGLTLQIGLDNPAQDTNGQSLHWLRFTRQANSCPNGPLFRRGDSNANGSLDIADPIANLEFQFLGTFLPPCKDAFDYDDNGEIDISDALASLTYQFLGGSPPSPPGMGSCGPDPTPDRVPGGDLGCESFPANRCE